MKKTVKRFMSAFLALVMVLSLSMSIGSVTAFATETGDLPITEATEVTPSSITPVYTGSDWKFYSRRDSNTGNVTGSGRFYATAGQTINFCLSGVHSSSSQGFNVYVYRANSAGAPLAEGRRGPYHVDGNLPGGYTLALRTEYTGYHIISCQRTNDGYQQIFDSVTILVG